jgi:hypothetical protein
MPDHKNSASCVWRGINSRPSLSPSLPLIAMTKKNRKNQRNRLEKLRKPGDRVAEEGDLEPDDIIIPYTFCYFLRDFLRYSLGLSIMGQTGAGKSTVSSLC